MVPDVAWVRCASAPALLFKAARLRRHRRIVEAGSSLAVVDQHAIVGGKAGNGARNFAGESSAFACFLLVCRTLTGLSISTGLGEEWLGSAVQSKGAASVR